ncbi:hypothetical protein ABH158_15525, partial [Bacteroides ovatus]
SSIKGVFPTKSVSFLAIFAILLLYFCHRHDKDMEKKVCFISLHEKDKEKYSNFVSVQSF